MSSIATGERDTATVTMRRVLYFGVSLIGVAFSLLSYSQNVAERSELLAAWSIPSFTLLLSLPLLIVIGATWMHLSLLRFIAATQIIVFCVALATWPLAFTPSAVFDGTRPWIFGHFATTVSLVGILLPEVATWVIIAVLSAASGVLRVIAEGTDATSVAIQDSLFNLMVGTILVAIIQVTLRAGRARDSAAAATARTMAAKAAIEAQNLQRARVAAIIHDDVISTLIAAARFDETTGALVRGYATKALARLDALRAGSGNDDDVIWSEAFAATLRSTAPMLANDVAFATHGTAVNLPASVGEALLEAASEALRNSQRHAGICTRSVAVETHGGGIHVTILDDGIGFDPRNVSPERFGIAVSIRDRMAAVNGSSDIVSTSGGGTRVVLGWEGAA